MPSKEVFTSVDIESSGPVPGIYSMLSFGACNVDNPDERIYTEFKPISKRFVPEALRVTGFSLEELMEKGVEPKLGMEEIAEWVNDTAREGRPVFTAFNATYDWQFPNYYFHRFLGRNPFGISGLDIKAYYMGKFGTSWAETTKRRLDPIFLSDQPHTHNALDDAIEQAEIFKKIRDHK